jgi:hypothetical protein
MLVLLLATTDILAFQAISSFPCGLLALLTHLPCFEPVTSALVEVFFAY